MNVLFHLAVGTSIVAASTKSEIKSNTDLIYKTVLGSFYGVLSHGILDYTPHCYPIHSKADVIIGIFFIFCIFLVTKKKWKIVVTSILISSILPDLIDLAPSIINTLIGTNFTTFSPIFPWHIHEYSGSIYTENCSVSNINHILVILFSSILTLTNRKTLYRIISSPLKRRL